MVFALKGATQANKPIIVRPSYVDLTFGGRPVKVGMQLWPIGTDTAKSTVYQRFEIEAPGPGYIHYYTGLPDDYFKGATAELLEPVVDKRGFAKTQWVLPSGARNEPLDLEVYAYAAALRVGISRMNEEDWSEIVIFIAELQILDVTMSCSEGKAY